jgi:hypothetical protein
VPSSVSYRAAIADAFWDYCVAVMVMSKLKPAMPLALD